MKDILLLDNPSGSLRILMDLEWVNAVPQEILKDPL